MSFARFNEAALSQSSSLRETTLQGLYCSHAYMAIIKPLWLGLSPIHTLFD